MVIVSPWTKRGVFSGETTNISVISLVQHLFGLAPLNSLNARQNDLAGAFDFRQRPLPPPAVPVAPPATIGFYGASVLDDVGAMSPGRPVTIELRENSPGLALDTHESGPVSLTVTPPAGVAVPASVPGSVELSRGLARLTVAFPSPGYYRLEARGPGGSLGWLTLDVGVNPNTP
jgi:phospholipase C